LISLLSKGDSNLGGTAFGAQLARQVRPKYNIDFTVNNFLKSFRRFKTATKLPNPTETKYQPIPRWQTTPTYRQT
jgi:hypothetical protein